MFGLGSRLNVIVSVTSPQPAPLVSILTTHEVGANTVWFNVPVISYSSKVPALNPNTKPFGSGVNGSTIRLVAPSNSRIIALAPLKSIPVEQ